MTFSVKKNLKCIMCISVYISDLLDHDGDILVQVAAVELHQIYENMEKVRCETYVHPQEDKAGWGRGEKWQEQKKYYQ